MPIPRNPRSEVAFPNLNPIRAVTPNEFGAIGDGEHDDTAAVQAAFNCGYPVFIPVGEFLCGTLVLPVSGKVNVTGAGKGLAVIKVKAGAQFGIKTSGFGVRGDTDEPVMVIGHNLRNFSVDISAMGNSAANAAIAMEDGYDHTLKDVGVIDPLNEASLRWGLLLGRALYTTDTYNCSIGRVAHLGSGLSSPNNFGTTVRHYKLDTWHIKGRYYQNVLVSGGTIQKDVDKFDVDGAVSGWSIVGCDIENGGNFINVGSVGGAANFFTAGNSFGGFTGRLFGGVGGMPIASDFLDIFSPQAGRPIAGIARVGTVATVQVATNLANGVFKWSAPEVGDKIRVTGCGAPFDSAGGQVVTSVDRAANKFTFNVEASGPLVGANGAFAVDNQVNGRYNAHLNGDIVRDGVAPRLLLNKRLVMPNQIPLAGIDQNGAEVTIAYVDSIGRQTFGDPATNFYWFANEGHMRCGKAGKGIVLSSPDGLVTKLLSVANDGTLSIVSV